MEILGFIPARGGSKGIPNKNIVELCGKPLIEYTYEAAEKSKYLSRIVLSTDDDKIAQTATYHKKIEVMTRPVELARDDTKTSDVIYHTLQVLKDQKQYIPDYIVILQPTSPLRTTEDIDACLEMLLSDSENDSVVSVQKVPHNYIPEKLMKLEEGRLSFYDKEGTLYTTRQKLPEYYARNGAAIYAFKTSIFEKTGSYYGDICLPYVMPEDKSVDIDTVYDLRLARILMETRLNR